MFTELLYEPSGEFENFCRMPLTDFEYLLCKISPFIMKENTQLREAIPLKIILLLLWGFWLLVTVRSLHFLFKVSNQVISNIVPEVYEAINEVLKDFLFQSIFINLVSYIMTWKLINNYHLPFKSVSLK